MWAILWNRILIGALVFVAGFLNYHVLLKMRFLPWIRGAVIGAFVSMDAALGSLIGGYVPEAFWGSLIAGAIYGLIIDVVATKIAGDGQTLVTGWTR